jgi:4-amino-4-deoxy-L-arabinose transferase
MTSRVRVRIALLAVAAALVMFARTGTGLLSNYDDCYYAEKAKEMLHGGDWLTPHFGGIVRLDNPPLFLWMVAAGMALFGVGKLGAVFFSAASGAGCVLLVVRLARRLGLDELESFSAGVILLTTQYFVKYAGHAMMDVPLTLLFLVALDGYVSAVEGRRSGWLQLGVATGLGVLMKSVLGLFPLIVAVVHRLTVRRGRAFAEPGIWVASLSALATFAPWFIYQWAVHPATLVDEHFGWLIWSRGFSEPARGGLRHSALGYLYGIGKLYWPWLPFAVAGIWMERKGARPAYRLLFIWLVVVIGTMSLGHVRKMWYVMSAFPCLALFAAMAVGRLLPGELARKRAMAWSLGAVLAAAVLLAFTPVGLSRPRQADLHEIATIVRTAVPGGETVNNLDAPYWDVACLFLFYSDHDLTQAVNDPAQVRQRLAQGGWGLIAAPRVDEIVSGEPGAIRVIARSGNWALLSGSP